MLLNDILPYEQSDGIATITIHRPEIRSAISGLGMISVLIVWPGASRQTIRRWLR